LIYGFSGNRRVPVKVACWNVRTMLRAGKLANIRHQMKTLRINILEISKTMWPEDNDFSSDEFRVTNSSNAKRTRWSSYYSGTDNGI